jgi:uncharacterized repeat protein (TIGR01451 family)
MNPSSNLLIKGLITTFSLSFFLLFLGKTTAQPTGFTDQLFMGGWDEVSGFVWDANGRMYVWERDGRVWTVENGVKSTTPLLDISDEVGGWRDFGLLGFALDPNFLSNGYYYLLYVVDRHHLLYAGTPQYNPNTNEYFAATIGRITRYQADIATNFTTTIPSSRFVLIGENVQDGPAILHESHGTGSLVFGDDGTLLATLGDGASYNSADQGSASETYWQQGLNDGIITPAENIGAYRCQTLDNYNGKILRLNPLTGEGLPSNPFWDANNPKSPASRIWARGVRNPYRMTLVPESGSHVPSDGNPGVFIFGDVGWGSREELDIVTGPGMNFGWPKYEGMTYQPGYNNSNYLPAQHDRPKVDWRTGSPRGLVNGSIVNVGSATLPGPTFNGNASTGGVWFHGHDFPSEWHDTYFHADYGAGWIRNFRFDANWNPVEVKNFINAAGPCIFLNTDPFQESLYYVRWPDQIRQVSYTGITLHTPVAIASANVVSGTSPLTVSFSSLNTYDEDGDPLSLLWDFGDGTTSTLPNPSHTFTGSGATGFNVMLTATDLGGLTGVANLNISLNNAAPVIQSTSVDAINTFNPNATTNISLSATVVDANHTAGQLSYLWDIRLYHNNHNHPLETFTTATANTNLTAVECYAASYWYRVNLTVTDPTGASDFYQKDIFPACAGNGQSISFSAIADKTVTDGPFALSATATSGLPVTFYVTDGPASVLGNTLTLDGVPGEVTIAATQPGNGTFAPAFNVEQSFTVTVGVVGNCPGTGLISREVWTGVTGVNVSQIPLTSPPNITDQLTIFEIPVNTLDNFGTRVRGYVCPPISGNYRFWLASDDGGELWLSTDDNPANKQLIATVPTWTNSREWGKFPEQQSAYIYLTAGQPYYIEALQKEQTGGDNLAVGWQLPNWSQERPIPGNRLLPFGGNVPQDQTINFPIIPNKETVDVPFTISASATSGLPVSFQVVSGPATLSGNTVSLTGQAGTVIIRATQSGNAQWNAAPSVDRTFQVTAPTGGGEIDLSLSVTSNPASLSVYNNISFTFTVENTGASSASGVEIFVPKPAAVVWVGGNEFTASTGSYNYFGNQIWTVGNLPAGASETITVNWYVLAADPLNAWAEVKKANETDPDSTPGNGTCCSSNEDDEAALTVTVPGQGPQNQSINFPTIPNKESDDLPFAISASATSGLPVSFSIVSGPATISGNTITLNGTTGSVTVRATQSGNANWNAATPVERTFLVNEPGLADQTITFASLTNKQTTSAPFTLSATASSGLPVSFSIVSGPATISGNTLTLDGVPGSVVVRASQGGNAQYNPAADVDRSFVVTTPGGSGGVDLELTMAASPTTVTQWGTIAFTATLTNNGVTAASNVQVHFPKPASVVFVGGNEVTVSKGTYNYNGNQIWTVGNMPAGATETITVNWFILEKAALTGWAEVKNATPSDDDSTPGNGACCSANEDDEAAFTATVPGAGPQDQTINFPTIPDKESDDLPFTISASATSGLPVSLAIVSGPASIAGNTITLTGALGQVTVRATQTGNANWNAATPVERTFSVNVPGLDNQTITFPSISNKQVTDAPFAISATASSGLPVSFSIDAGPASIAGNTITLAGTVGQVTVRASQSGNAQYNPAPDVLRTFAVTQPGQGGPDLEVNMTASSSTLLIWQNVTFSISLTNAGDETANNIRLDVPIPQGLAYTSSNLSQGSYDLFYNEWVVGSLAAGETVTAEMVLFCLQNTTALPYFVQVITASPADLDSSPDNNPSGTPAEDDEALVTLDPFNNPLVAIPGAMFSLNANKVGAITYLLWISNLGKNGVEYILERSANGYEWQAIGSQPNTVFDQTRELFENVDEHPLPGWNFYRIRLLQTDGTSLFSNVVMLEHWDDLYEFKLFPNPANEYVDVNLFGAEGQRVRLLLVDRMGRLVKEMEVEYASSAPHRMELDGVPEGWYVLWIQAAGQKAKALRLVVGKR